MRVIGTAGHVDHGKSTLVHALTGIDPDRLREEKEREMTIDLGFAWLGLPPAHDALPGTPGEQVGVIDVPGHIDFIKNMLAGVGGIDAALFVVAADEGVMPRTREHLAILDLLQISNGVIALTKMDAISEEGWLDLVEADLREVLRDTCLGEARIVPVSARTGAGLSTLKQALADVLAQAPPRRDQGQPRLPVDRVFTVAGFGTVVTGTLSDGQFRVGDEVEIVPAGLKARIRGMQTHKKAVEIGLPGSRLAVNLTGVHPDELRRGMVIARPGTLQPTTMVDARLRLVRGEAGQPALRHSQPVDFFSGAAEVPGRVRLLDAEQLAHGRSGWVQLVLDAPVAVAPGDRFIIRQASPSLTLGGGNVVNPHPRRRWRRFQPDLIAQLETLARGTPDDLVLHALQSREPAPLKAVIEASGLDTATAEAVLAGMLEQRGGDPPGRNTAAARAQPGAGDLGRRLAHPVGADGGDPRRLSRAVSAATRHGARGTQEPRPGPREVVPQAVQRVGGARRGRGHTGRGRRDVVPARLPHRLHARTATRKWTRCWQPFASNPTPHLRWPRAWRRPTPKSSARCCTRGRWCG